MEPQIDATLVEQLVRSQHPRLSGPVDMLAHGWDNDIYCLGDELLVRLPRRRVASELIAGEQRWLPTIAALLPVPVPTPVAAGLPEFGYPFRWSITPWLAGTPAFHWSLADRAVVADQLADALLALHVPAPIDAPVNPVRGVPLARRDSALRARLPQFASADTNSAAAIESAWERALAAPAWSGPALWLHGDLHPANILLEERTDGLDLAAIIDFGDLTSGDPATDLALAWLMLDGSGRARFRERMAPDQATWDRARGWALNMATAMIVGSPEGAPTIPIGRAALEQVLAD
ncbi:aminoglycoside phosphotransferase family protein [Lacisediminihabitans changchengi]|uniref:Aminoglycoside phosphotransferase family protein n=1 Tax=Lacisediminihabitans changchengi TaxID=2787634 RepID=A0A934SKU9_9MICO|nr:aminoglycoside phosphotransferase family protein [Lacisediminihabitans changchengi]MBK4348471.1 aminoglycoside phosphotransferase family protein [Lacisediminihabitans changchengi]